MAITSDLMGVGMSPALASLLGNTLNGSTAATQAGNGTAQVGATLILSSTVRATTTGGNTAFILRSGSSLTRLVFFYNTSATAALLYPPSGGSINGAGTNAAISVPQNILVILELVANAGGTAPTWIATSTYTAVSAAAAGIAPAGGFSAPTAFHTGDVGIVVGTAGNNTTPSVTAGYVAEVFIPLNTTITGIALLNGSAAAGNIQLALYNSAGALLANTASTAQSGTNAYQQVALTAPLAVLGPAKYYIMAQFNNTSARFQSHILGNFTTQSPVTVYGTFAAITPPTTFTTNVGPIADTY